ncbi:MFS general substrate transporter [Thozetella sp. PMI_491]|nr:MFS general substrate transporter [Thozetella sp. PMI_491]
MVMPRSSAQGGDDAASSTPLLQPDSASTLGPASSSSSSVRSLSPLARRPNRGAADITRTISFASAVLSALCAGSVAVFSLYGHIFQERLHYNQFQVNGVASAASIASYLPVPLMGYACDRLGPAPLSLASAVLFGGGYGLAAGLYQKGLSNAEQSPRKMGHDYDLEYAAMLGAFVAIGVGTCCMYLSAVATCAKNFGKGKHRGLALAVPIASYGLSSMWQSQVGSKLLYERNPDGSKGDVNVFHFFLFLAILLAVVGVLGTFGLRIVDEQDLIDEGFEELERSGILDGSALFTPSVARSGGGYGSMDRGDPFDEEDDALLDPAKDPEEEEARIKKQWVLNAETRRFLTDHTMWCFSLGFFFMIGPAEAFINNLGTVIKTLYPPSLTFIGDPTSAATHVSILGITSTVIRLLTGSLTDLLAPSPAAQHIQITSSTPMLQRPKFSVSRVAFLLFFALTLSLGMVILASGLMQNHGERFWIVSGLIGAGYGAVFSLTPIIVTVIWGVENFATNWGIVAMFPALGATLWGLIYSAVYQAGAGRASSGGDEEDTLCYGTQCYAKTFWLMAFSVWIACGLVFWAWKGRKGWAQQGIVI